MAEHISVDLGPVISHISAVARDLDRNVAVVDAKVQDLATRAAVTHDTLQKLAHDFQVFVDSDRKAKELQKALTEIIRVRQELEKKFGHYDEVRRTTTGILQATDAGLVQQNTIHNVTEELMLNAPGYWLAPTLVALSAWIKDDRDLADRAMRTAISRDDSKTSLFFALVCRRARRSEASSRWLARYFQLQTPMVMDRELVVMLDAVANGVFGGSALAACSTVMEEWIAELEMQAGFLEEQRARWGKRLDVMAPVVANHEYKVLRAHSSTARELLQSLSAARRNQVVLNFFSKLFIGEIVVPRSLETAVDDILSSLVTNFDDEELPLRKEERLYQLIKEEEGDLEPAKRRLASEHEVFEEKANFAALLTNSAMNPEQVGATMATQRYAVSRSRHWVLAAHQDLVARDRAMVPQIVHLSYGLWKGTTFDGSNEAQIKNDINGLYDSKLENELASVKLGPGAWIGGGGLIVAGMWLEGRDAFGFMMVLLSVGYLAWLLLAYRKKARIRDDITKRWNAERTEVVKMARACLAELVDLRREVALEDAKATSVSDLLEALHSTQYVLQRPEQARASVA